MLTNLVLPLQNHSLVLCVQFLKTVMWFWLYSLVFELLQITPMHTGCQGSESCRITTDHLEVWWQICFKNLCSLNSSVFYYFYQFKSVRTKVIPEASNLSMTIYQRHKAKWFHSIAQVSSVYLLMQSFSSTQGLPFDSGRLWSSSQGNFYIAAYLPNFLSPILCPYLMLSKLCLTLENQWQSSSHWAGSIWRDVACESLSGEQVSLQSVGCCQQRGGFS